MVGEVGPSEATLDKLQRDVRGEHMIWACLNSVNSVLVFVCHLEPRDCLHGPESMLHAH